MSYRVQENFKNTRLQDVFNMIRHVTLEPNIVNATIVHSLTLKVGCFADLRAATSLLTVYSRTGYFGSSMALFDEVRDKDTIFLNAMMSAYIENKWFEVAFDLFVKMIGEGIEFDPTTLVIVISSLSNNKSLVQGQLIHGLSIKAGMLSDTFLSNAVIDMYAKCGHLGSSEFVFAEMERRDIVSWNSIISGCLYNNQYEKSLWYLKEMNCSENRANGVTISCAIATCTCLQEFSVGLAVHGWGIRLGCGESHHIAVANSLISFYSQFRDVNAAECIFEEMVVTNVISWNAMIKGLALNGGVQEAVNLLHDMQFVRSVEPDITTLVTVLPLCSELMLLREGKSVHGFIIRREMGSELSVVNCLMDMYSKCDNVEKSEYLFWTMPKKDLVTWNTMISGYAQNGRSWEAQNLFKKLLSWCSTCTLPTLLAILPSCDSPESLEFGRSIHGWHQKLGLLNDILASNSLMYMYICCGDLPSASTLLCRISAKADVTSWNTFITGCTQKSHFWEALQCFNFMRQKFHIDYDSITLVSVVSASGNLELALQGKLIHGLALKTPSGLDIRVQNSLVTMYGRLGDTESARLIFNHSHNHNLCSWNCMISAFMQNEDAKKALELFRVLDFEPNEITISTIVSACTQLGILGYGKQIHGHVFRFGFDKNPFISAALLDMYSNCGRLDVALRVFHSSPEKSVSAWNSLISAYGFHNNTRQAIETFKEMIDSGISPTNSTFVNLLSVCSHSGLVNEGCWYYDHMFSKYGVHPATEHHVCMVDMLGRSGRLREAYDFIKKLKIPPDPGIWGALLSACNYHGDLDMGREVADILFSLEPENVSYYVALCNMYVAAGRWEEAVNLRTIIQDKQLKKPVGYSLIDVGLISGEK
ncbi:Tetratricopeptide repeat (TPR)-like superfamily protein [Forsythia ovata]|uniref:Tetratricopeptide repeat (TPR)-like superfamily protein n=1 Tax=Forsythia ovata TaxID=205694 RepID=A0ABD1W488_9LAMI